MTVKYESFKDEVTIEVEKANRRALTAAAIELAGEAKKLTPVDTGRLRASIAWAATEERTHADSAKGIDGKDVYVSYAVSAPEGHARVGTNVEYAVYVHENLDAHHPIGRSKFIEVAFTNKRERVINLIDMIMKGEL